MSEKEQGRNIMDVAMELTRMHIHGHPTEGVEELKKVYTEYYSLAKALGAKSGKSLMEFLPEDIKDKIED